MRLGRGIRLLKMPTMLMPSRIVLRELVTGLTLTVLRSPQILIPTRLYDGETASK